MGVPYASSDDVITELGAVHFNGFPIKLYIKKKNKLKKGASSWSDLPVSGRVEVPPRSDLPLNRILYIPFSKILFELCLI